MGNEVTIFDASFGQANENLPTTDGSKVKRYKSIGGVGLAGIGGMASMVGMELWPMVAPAPAPNTEATAKYDGATNTIAVREIAKDARVSPEDNGVEQAGNVSNMDLGVQKVDVSDEAEKKDLFLKQVAEISQKLNRQMKDISDADLVKAEAKIVEARLLQVEIVKSQVLSDKKMSRDTGLVTLFKALEKKFDANTYVVLMSRFSILRTYENEDSKDTSRLLLTPTEQVRIFAIDGVMSAPSNLNKKGVRTGPNYVEHIRAPFVTSGLDVNGKYSSEPINPSVLLGQKDEPECACTIPNALSLFVLGELDDSVKIGMGTVGGIDFAKGTDVYVLGTKKGEPLAAVGFATWGLDAFRNKQNGSLAKWIYGSKKGNPDLTNRQVSEALGFVRHPASLFVDNVGIGDKFNIQAAFTKPTMDIRGVRSSYGSNGKIPTGRELAVRMRKVATDGIDRFDLNPAVSKTGIIILTYGTNKPDVFVR